MHYFGVGHVPARARLAALAALLTCCMLGAPPVRAAPAAGGISVTVVTGDGRPISGAVVTVRGSAGARIFRTDLRGAAGISGLAPGVYVVAVSAAGFATLSGRTIDVYPGLDTAVRMELVNSSSSLVVLGRVTTKSGEALSTSSAPSQELDAQRFAASGGADVAGMIAQDAISAAITRPAGGNPAAPAVVALRGSDPTETLIDVDGHSVNSGGTGAFDLSLVDPAALAGVQLVYGIAPSSLIGPNTIDGAINIRTLDPTSRPSGLVRISAGSFGSVGETLQETGTAGRLGYVFSVHRTTSQGEVYGEPISTTAGGRAIVGSAVAGTTGLLKVRYDLARPDEYVALTVRDQSDYRDLSAALTSRAPPSPGPPLYLSFAGSSLAGHNGAYGLDARVPLGRADSDGLHSMSAFFSHLTLLGDQSVDGPGSSTTPYLFNTRDLVADDTLQVDRPTASGMLSLKLGLRSEGLATQTLIGGTPEQARTRKGLWNLALDAANAQPLPPLSQTHRSAVLRYTFDTTPTLHYSAAVYLSDFSSFGSSVDPRLGLVWTPSAVVAVRGSIGTTFQSPQLPELYVPAVLPPPDANGFVNIGNPNLKADHATDFDFGVARVFSSARNALVDLDVYQSNLRAPAVRFIPSVRCLPPNPPPPSACESFPINAGGAVYRGIELRAQRSISPTAQLRLAYSVNSSFATSVSPQFQSGRIVPGEQFQSVPLHRGALSVQSYGGADVTYEAGANYEDSYNELNRPAFVSTHAGVTWHRKGLDIGLYGTNLTNVYDDRFTLSGRGQPYGGVDGPLPSDAYSLQGRAFTLVLTRRY